MDRGRRVKPRCKIWRGLRELLVSNSTRHEKRGMGFERWDSAGIDKGKEFNVSF
jgi:hypothetical protein